MATRPEAGLIAVASLAGCMSFDGAVAEFDAVTGRAGLEREPQSIGYDYRPELRPWLVRNLDGLLVGWLLEKVFASEPSPVEVENPVELARESLQVMASEAGRRPDRISEAAVRMLWVLEFGDGQPLNQVAAVQGLADFAHTLEIVPHHAVLPDPERTTQEAVREWLDVMERHWPPEREAPLSLEEKAAYAAALRDLTEMPLPGSRDQRALVLALGRGLQLEPDPELAQELEHALRSALQHAISLGLRGALFASSPRVRERAMVALYRLGGPPALPWLLATVGDPPDQVRSGGSRFDDDPFVRLTLIRMCGQLTGDAARRRFGDGVAPIEYLYDVAVTDADSGLRVVALEALARSLRRPVSFDDAWAREWWRDEHVPGRGRVLEDTPP